MAATFFCAAPALKANALRRRLTCHHFGPDDARGLYVGFLALRLVDFLTGRPVFFLA